MKDCHEITEIPKLLEFLNVTGYLVTICAMDCRRKIAQKIVDKSANYLLAVKGNLVKLEDAINFLSLIHVARYC